MCVRPVVGFKVNWQTLVVYNKHVYNKHAYVWLEGRGMRLLILILPSQTLYIL